MEPQLKPSLDSLYGKKIIQSSPVQNCFITSQLAVPPHIVRGDIQTIVGKINVIMTLLILTSLPPSP